jgi:hypothetical protein
MMDCAARLMLFIPEAHTLFTVRATVDLGSPEIVGTTRGSPEIC